MWTCGKPLIRCCWIIPQIFRPIPDTMIIWFDVPTKQCKIFHPLSIQYKKGQFIMRPRWPCGDEGNDISKDDCQLVYCPTPASQYTWSYQFLTKIFPSRPDLKPDGWCHLLWHQQIPLEWLCCGVKFLITSWCMPREITSDYFVSFLKPTVTRLRLRADIWLGGRENNFIR